jgi:hypothetical protein
MDKAVVERALRALAEIGAARSVVPDLPRKMAGLANFAPDTLKGRKQCIGTRALRFAALCRAL